jgi:hypothetical protein
MTLLRIGLEFGDNKRDADIFPWLHREVRRTPALSLRARVAAVSLNAQTHCERSA